MTHKVQFNPSFIGALALDAAKYAYMLDKGPHGKDQYEKLIALINCLHVDYLATSQLDHPLRQVLDLWRSGEDLATMGELILDYLDDYALEDR